MLSENEKRIKELCQELGQCLYEQSQVEKFNNLAEIEETVRDLMIGVCQPRNRYFFVKTSTGETAGRTRKVKSILGELPITEKQAKKLEVKPRTQMSPMLEKNCLLLSGDESYEKSAQKIKSLTGIAVSHSTQQRLVHRYAFEELPSNPEVEVEEMSLDGGKVRLRTAKGKALIWRDYKAVSFHQLGVAAFFQDNSALLDLVNSQVLAEPLICLGDGHDGIWNLFGQIGEKQERIEILDWYHLIENLYKVGGSFQRIDEVKCFLWKGEVDAAISCFEGWSEPQVENFIIYLNKHKHRIVNYGYLQAEGISIGSGSVESKIKQIAHRLKITGASWESGNVPQVLRHRSAYLNGCLF